MTVDDYSSGLNVRRHQNKLGTAISDSRTGGPRRRQQIGSGARRAGSFLVDLRARRFLAALLAHPIHFSIDVLLLTHDATPVAGQANQSCHPLIQYSRAARRPPARFCLAMSGTCNRPTLITALKPTAFCLATSRPIRPVRAATFPANSFLPVSRRTSSPTKSPRRHRWHPHLLHGTH